MKRDGIAVRDSLYRANQLRLEQIAWRGIHVRGMKPHDFIVVCIDVDDPAWTGLVEALMPNNEAEWQSYRDQNMAPVARGSVIREGVAEYLAEVVPVLKTAMLHPERTGMGPDVVQAVVMGCGGASMYHLTPRPDKS